MTSSALPFVGRQAELREVRQLLHRLARGRGGALVILGEAGVGKTRLLAEARVLAGRAHVVVAGTVALPLATRLPRDVIGELLEALRSAGRLRSARLPAGTAAFRALAGRLAQCAAEGPLCLIVDDAHWADRATIDLLHYGVARLVDVPVGWLLAARPGGAAARLGHDLVSRGLARGCELHPFSVAETTRLLDAHLRREDRGGLGSMLHQRTGGNPLLLTEVIRAGLATGQHSLMDDLERVVPGSVRDWLAARLAVLPDGDADVLAWLALLPEPVQLGWLTSLAQPVPESQLRASLTRLTAERIVADGADGVRFRHALIRDAATGRLSSGEHRRRCAAALDVVDQAPAWARASLLEAAGRDGEAAACYLHLADEALNRGGGRDAERLYQRAETLARQAGQAATRLDATGGRVLAMLQDGRKEQAVFLADQLRPDLAPVRGLTFLTQYALALYDHASDLDAAERALGLAAGPIAHATGRPLAEALLARAFVLTMAGRSADAVPDAERAVQVARELHDPALEIRALNRLGLAIGQAVAAHAGMDILRQAFSLAEAAGLATEAALACLNLSYFATICCAAEAMRDWATRGLAVPGLSANLEAILRSNAGDALMALGDLNGALAYHVSARAVAGAIGPPAENRVAVSHALALTLRGDLVQARRTLAPLKFVPGSMDDSRALDVLAFTDEEDGKLAAALAGYRSAAGVQDNPNSAWSLAGVARTGSQLGELTTAATAAEQLGRLAERWPAAGWLSVASEGWLALADAKRERAAELFTAAAATSSEAFERARLTVAAGLAIGDRRQIERGYDAYARMGAALAAQRTRAAAWQSGVRLRAVPLLREPLTRRELEVALLVAAGKTNAEIASELFVSNRTVEHHVEHIIAKLGYRSRVDIAAQVAAGRLPAADPSGRHNPEHDDDALHPQRR